MIGNAIDHLLPNRMVRHNGPSTVSVNLLQLPAKNKVAVHLLSYIPVRRSEELDIIEERTVVRDVAMTFHLGRKIKNARIVPDGKSLAMNGDSLVVPEINGYAIVELELE